MCGGQKKCPKNLEGEKMLDGQPMSPVSPVFHTEARVRIGLKNALRKTKMKNEDLNTALWP